MSGGEGSPITISLHICGITTDGKLWHASRPRNDSGTALSWGPWSPWEEVKAQGATDGGPFVSADCTVIWNDVNSATVEEFHVYGVTQDGRLLHTSRVPGQDWLPFEDLTTRIKVDGDTFQVQDVTLGHFLISVDICVLVLTTSGQRRILHGSRDTWEDLNAPQLADFPESFVSVGCAVVGFPVQELHVCGVTEDGKLWHTLGSDFFFDNAFVWLPFADVQTASADGPGGFANVRIAQGGRGFQEDSDLHVFAQAAGDLWHTVRISGLAGWQPIFDRVKELAGDPGSFDSISAANVEGQLHLCGVTQDGKLWHTIRIDSSFPRGWERFEDVTAAGGGHPGTFRFVCVAANFLPPGLSGGDNTCQLVSQGIANDWQQISMMQQRNPNDPRIASRRQHITHLQDVGQRHKCP